MPGKLGMENGGGFQSAMSALTVPHLHLILRIFPFVDAFLLWLASSDPRGIKSCLRTKGSRHLGEGSEPFDANKRKAYFVFLNGSKSIVNRCS